MTRIGIEVPASWNEIPVGESEPDQPVPFLRLALPDTKDQQDVIIELIALAADGDADAVLPSLITVNTSERGPRVPDTSILANGVVAHRSLGAVPGSCDGVHTSVEFLCLHALRLGDVDVIARTWLGTTPWSLPEVIGPLETMLATITIEP